MRFVVKTLEAVLVGVGFVWLLNRGFELMNKRDTVMATIGLLLDVGLVAGMIAWLGHKIGRWGAHWHGPWPRLVALAAVLVVASGCTRIGPGYVGIKVSMAGSNRGVEDLPATTGWVFYNPLATNIYEYPTFVQSVVWTQNKEEGRPANEEITFTNADQMQVAVDVALAYHIEGNKVPQFYMKFRNDKLEDFTYGYLHSLARDKFNDIAGRYHIEQIMGDNGPFLREVKSALQKDLDPIGIVLEPQFGIIGAPRPPPSVIQSINAKVQAVQIAQQKQNEVVQAEADARKAVAAAEGQARAILAVAAAQAQANRQLAESLTPTLIQYKQLEKWNGVLPTYTGGGAVPFLTMK
jgi:regulator of protease activity HflC (stomatin/prohibitin superfamily)